MRTIGRRKRSIVAAGTCLGGILVLAIPVAHAQSADPAGLKTNFGTATATVQTASAALGETYVRNFSGLAVEYTGWDAAIGQSPDPRSPDVKQPVSGGFQFERRGRALLYETLVNAGGTDRSYRRVMGAEDGWNLWIARDQLSRLDGGELDRLARDWNSYPPALNPASLLAEAMDNPASLRWLGSSAAEARATDEPVFRVAFTASWGTTYTLSIGADGLPLCTEQVVVAAGRDEVASVCFADYRTVGDGLVPYEITFLLGDRVVGERRMAAVEPQPDHTDDAYAPPDLEFVEYLPRFQPHPIADGVNILRVYSGPGNTYNVLLVELDSSVVVVEPPLTDLLARPIAGIAGRVSGGKPVRHVVATHHHSDHIGGARGFVALGATLYSTEHGVQVFEELAGASSFLAGNPLADVDDFPASVAVLDRLTIGGSTRRVELFEVGATPHAQQMLIVYVPHARTVYVADLFAIPDSGVFPQSSGLFDAFRGILADLALDVEHIVPAHGLPGTPADLERAVAAPGGEGPP